MQQIVNKSRVSFIGSGVATFLLLTVPQLAQAQSSLQQTTSQSGLQPQSSQSQTQATTNTQNQVGGLQQNTGASVLSQSSSHALGVVSDPTQTRPEVVVQPSNTLSTTPVTKKEVHPNSPIALVVGLIVVLAGAVYWIGQRFLATTPAVPPHESLVYASTQTGPVKQKHKKKRSKKKRTPHQR